jgi:rhamnose transport system substrate-binding protein/rhamnose transport system permease protein
MDLGYLAVQAANQLVKGDITTSSTSITAGRLGSKEIKDREIVLGDALIFDAKNVDNFNY